MKLLSIVSAVLLILYGLNELLSSEWKEAIINISTMAACVIAIVDFNSNSYGQK